MMIPTDQEKQRTGQALATILLITLAVFVVGIIYQFRQALEREATCLLLDVQPVICSQVMQAQFQAGFVALILFTVTMTIFVLYEGWKIGVFNNDR